MPYGNQQSGAAPYPQHTGSMSYNTGTPTHSTSGITNSNYNNQGYNDVTKLLFIVDVFVQNISALAKCVMFMENVFFITNLDRVIVPRQSNCT